MTPTHDELVELEKAARTFLAIGDGCTCEACVAAAKASLANYRDLIAKRERERVLRVLLWHFIETKELEAAEELKEYAKTAYGLSLDQEE